MINIGVVRLKVRYPWEKIWGGGGGVVTGGGEATVTPERASGSGAAIT